LLNRLGAGTGPAWDTIIFTGVQILKKGFHNVSFLTCAAALVLAGCGGGAGGGAVAVVNGKPILREDFIRTMQLKSQATVIVDPGRLQTQGGSIPQQQYTGVIADGTVGFQTLKAMINDKIVLELAEKAKVLPTNDEINKEIEARKAENPNYLKQATGAGFTLEYLRTQLMVALAQEKFITAGITITDAQVDEYIKANPKMFVEPATAELLYIVAKDDTDRKAADSDLKGGQSFEDVARRYSADPNAAANQYRYIAPNGTIMIDAMPPAIQEIAKKTDESKQTDWMAQQGGYVKFFMRKKTAEKKMNIDDKIKAKVRRQLALEEGSKSIDLAKQVIEALKDSKVEINIDEYKIPFEKYIDGLRGNTTKSSGTMENDKK
jgi:parvulin-like peptidyl-prolyl isomerase